MLLRTSLVCILDRFTCEFLLNTPQIQKYLILFEIRPSTFSVRPSTTFYDPPLFCDPRLLSLDPRHLTIGKRLSTLKTRQKPNFS